MVAAAAAGAFPSLGRLFAYAFEDAQLSSAQKSEVFQIIDFFSD